MNLTKILLVFLAFVFAKAETPFRASSLRASVRGENVTIMAYNVNHLHYVFQITYRPRNEGPRLRRLNAAIRLLGATPTESAKFGQPDVIVVTEVMSNAADGEIGCLKDVYPHQTPRLGNDCQDPGFDSVTGCKDFLLNGGVKIISKLPILRADALAFGNRMNGDKLVNKGAVRVALRTTGGIVFHVVGTHMQSTATELQKTAKEEKEMRRKEMEEIVRWVEKLAVPANETVFVGGDFNVEFGTPEYRDFMAAAPLNVTYVPDPRVGGSFSAKFRGDATNWLTAYHLYGSNVSQMDETLDYVSYLTNHRRPTPLTKLEVIPIKSLDPWSWWRMKGQWEINGTIYYHNGNYKDLSDHYPVVQKFKLDAF